MLHQAAAMLGCMPAKLVSTQAIRAMLHCNPVSSLSTLGWRDCTHERRASHCRLGWHRRQVTCRLLRCTATCCPV
jgi:hypothetical protein